MKPSVLSSTLFVLWLASCGGGGEGSGSGGTPDGGGNPPVAVGTCVTPPTGVAPAGSAAQGSGGLRVVTLQGTFEGALESGARAFKGIRYAAPPTGCLRFRPPREPAPTDGVVPALSEGPRCYQQFNGALLGDEDCLFLNVWAPDDGAVHPVMVMLHGGNINAINAAKLAAATGLVVVAPNRRVGILGTLALQKLAGEASDRATGTYAVMDTLAALRWVQRNIAAFGGDPSRVLVNGGSAGGSIACSLFAAPSAKGLFSAAAVMSGLCRPRYVVDATLSRYSKLPPLETAHAALIGATGCDTAGNTLDCLRNLPPQTLVNAAAALPTLAGAPAIPVAPVIDGVVVTSDPYSALETGVAGNFRLIVGSMRDDIRNLLSLPGMDDAAYRNFLATNYGASAVDALHALYPPSQFPTPTDAAYLLLTELVFGCPAEALARAAGSRGASHLYLGTRSTRADGYATHGGEFPYLMDTLEERGIPVDQPAMDLRSALQSGFATLAASPTLAPLVDAGSQGNFSWPAYDPARPEVVEFGDQVRVINDYRNGRCATLAALLPP